LSSCTGRRQGWSPPASPHSTFRPPVLLASSGLIPPSLPPFSFPLSRGHLSFVSPALKARLQACCFRIAWGGPIRASCFIIAKPASLRPHPRSCLAALPQQRAATVYRAHTPMPHLHDASSYERTPNACMPTYARALTQRSKVVVKGSEFRRNVLANLQACPDAHESVRDLSLVSARACVCCQSLP
jgi:hypothetical protein